jgi:hypothetical protein
MCASTSGMETTGKERKEMQGMGRENIRMFSGLMSVCTRSHSS